MANGFDAVDVSAAGLRLHAALKGRAPEAVRRVLAEQPRAVDWRDGEGRTALHLTRDPVLVELLLAAGANVNIADSRGFTPLHRIQVAGPADVTRLLLGAGARLDTTDVDGWTPLHAAATFLGVESVELLLEHGADASARNRRGHTPLHEALEDGNARTVRHLWQNVENRDVFLAAGLGDLTFLGAALRAEPGLARAVDSRRRTPLHWAARCGQEASAGALLVAAAEPDARDEWNWTPLHWAAYGYPINERSPVGAASCEVAALLLQHGAERSPRDRRGKTPLDMLEAVHRDKPALARLLGGASA